MTPPLTFAAIAVTVLTTSFISGILGMAGGMILMAVLLALLLLAAMMLHGHHQPRIQSVREWHGCGAHTSRSGYFCGYALSLFAAPIPFALDPGPQVSKPVAYIPSVRLAVREPKRSERDCT